MPRHWLWRLSFYLGVVQYMTLQTPVSQGTPITVQELKSTMYADMKYTRGCYLLLNATGPVGCQAPNQQLVTAPLVHYVDLESLPGEPQVIVVVAAPDADAFLRKFLDSPQLRKQVVGVLVDPTAGRPTTQSSAMPFPGAQYALYNATDYVWNPPGTGQSREYFGIPIFMLTDQLAEQTLWRATYNAEHQLKGGQHVARLDLPMLATGNSSHCIAEDTCLPVGGYGVWTALPPIPDTSYNASDSARSITLLVAHLDSNSLFHDLTKSAGSATSGLIAAMVALDILVRSGAADTYTRQLVLVALAGEAWDFMGSRRLLYEMALDSKFVRGLKLELIDQVIEVGQVGGAFNKETNTSSLFLHAMPPDSGFGDASLLMDTAASVATREPQVQVERASATNPGLPPSSLMSFLRVNASIQGMMLTDFDSQYINPYFQSEYDDGFNVTIQAIVDAAAVLARTLHELVAPEDTPLAFNRSVAVELVYGLALCLISDDPGMRCPLAAQLMSPDVEVFYDGSTSATAQGYTGVLRWVDSNPYASAGKPNLARFVYNYLGNLTARPLPDPDNATMAPPGSNPAEGMPCDTTVNVCPEPLVCVGWRYGTKDASGMGRCRNTTTLYVPAYSTRLWYGPRNGVWRWYVDNTSASATWERSYAWPPDPMWTESNWPPNTPTVNVFQEESETTQIATLVVGLLVTAATGLATWYGMRAFEKHLKRH